jgi:hypothetical protein
MGTCKEIHAVVVGVIPAATSSVYRKETRELMPNAIFDLNHSEALCATLGVVVRGVRRATQTMICARIRRAVPSVVGALTPQA